MNQNNVVSLNEYKLAKNPNYVKAGDRIEWKDYDGGINIGTIKTIFYSQRNSDKVSIKNHLFFPILLIEEEFYSIELTDGMTILASIFVRKVNGKKINNNIAGRAK